MKGHLQQRKILSKFDKLLTKVVENIITAKELYRVAVEFWLCECILSRVPAEQYFNPFYPNQLCGFTRLIYNTIKVVPTTFSMHYKSNLYRSTKTSAEIH